jgi:hypothetical protein
MFGLSTIVQMNKCAAAMFKDKAPKSEAQKVREFMDELVGQVPNTPGTLAHEATRKRKTNLEDGFCAFNPVPHEAPKFDLTVQKKGPNMGCLVTPMTEAARNWLKARFCYSEDYRGASVIIKHRDLCSLLFDIERAGLTVEEL